MTDLGLKLPPDVAREKSGEVNGAKDWSETNGALPLARREPEGKDSDTKAEEEEDSKGSPVGTFIFKSADPNEEHFIYKTQL